MGGGVGGDDGGGNDGDGGGGEGDGGGGEGEGGGGLGGGGEGATTGRTETCGGFRVSTVTPGRGIGIVRPGTTTPSSVSPVTTMVTLTVTVGPLTSKTRMISPGSTPVKLTSTPLSTSGSKGEGMPPGETGNVKINPISTSV